MWEMEQLRLKRRLKEIDAASNKMRSEEMAQRERGDSGMASAIAQLTSQLGADIGANRPSENRSETSPTTTHFVVPPQAQNSAAGSNLAFENGKQVIPKSHTPYSPDPSRVKSILNKDTSSPSATDSNPSVPPTSSWNPQTAAKERNLDEL